MPAGYVTLNILDGDGTTRTARFMSSDGTTGGLLYSPAVLTTSAGVEIGLAPSATDAGLSKAEISSTASYNATVLKASAGNLYELDVINTAAYDIFLKFYNKATTPDPSADSATRVWTIPLKANGGSFSKSWPNGRYFDTGIGYVITKLVAATDETVIVALDALGSVEYK